MKTVAQVIAELQKFPPDAWCYAYEGEMHGIVVVALRDDHLNSQLGEIYVSESGDDPEETMIYSPK